MYLNGKKNMKYLKVQTVHYYFQCLVVHFNVLLVTVEREEKKVEKH
jgi:hypothetical protein